MNARMNAAAAAIAALALAACSAHPAESAPKPTPVHVTTARTGPAAQSIETNGVVATKDEMRLSFKVTGVIRSIHVRQGEKVAAGTRLAEIELTEIDSQVAQLQALATKAQRDLERGQRLYADHLISLEREQDLRTQLELQQAQLRSAEFNRGLAVIVAPRNGVVLRKLADERELIQAGQPVILLGAQDTGYVVRAGLADREVVQLALGDRAQVSLDAYPGRDLSGTLTEIASAADEKTGLFPIEVRLDAPSVRLATGLVAKLTLAPSSARTGSLTYVPVAAVVEGDGDRASVFVVQRDRVQRRPVGVAFIGEREIALARGVAAGEAVVTDGALYLTDGERVEVLNERTAATGSPVTAE
jgi:RND family efflux transporter MFP subunit